MSKHQATPGGPPRSHRGGPAGALLQGGEKPRNFKKTLKRLLVYLKPFRATLIGVLILAILSTAFAIAAPKISAQAMNKLQEGFMAQAAIEKTAEIQRSMKLPPPHITDIPDGSGKAAMLEKSLPAADKVGMTPEQIKSVIKSIRETNGQYDIDFIVRIVLLLLGIYIISALSNLIMGRSMAGVSQKLVRELRLEVDAKLDRLPIAYFDRHPHGDILSRMTNDIDTIAATLQQSLVQMITAVVSIIGYIIMMLSISFKLSLVVLGTLPFYILVTRLITKRSQVYFAEQQKQLGDLSGHVEEAFTGFKVIKAYGKEEESARIFNDINKQLFGAAWRAQFISGILFPCMSIISNLAYVGISVLGGIWITRSLLGIGDILAFIQYSRSFNMPIMQTANIANIIQSTLACSERIFEILDETEEEPDPLPADAPPFAHTAGHIEFDNVSFRYLPEESLIDDFNLDIAPGQTIAIVGPTGAGKTTLVNLLMRFYEIDSGAIRIDGRDIRSLSRKQLRSLFGMVLQDTWLFNGTISQNIAYGRPDATPEDIRQAAMAAHADHFIRTLPEGYETMLNEEASNISQGQKQLLTIARAILTDPPLLILDEATSSVDTRTEMLIQQAMQRLMKGRTSFVIAHRLSTIRDAGLIIVMDDGRIIETGTHAELIAKRGFYFELYNSQFAGAVS
ncbi:MAG TPA: ABC transporter ATP-binding protein [Clostridiales bacterium]|jgi:ATP-binding cassette subfamily B protein|nr:ABC transporter ATP-binding protein [Clostridiales bacterium]